MKPVIPTKWKMPLAVALAIGVFSSLQRLVFFTSTEWLNVGYAFGYNFTFSLLLWWFTGEVGRRVPLVVKVGVIYSVGFVVMSVVSYAVYEWSSRAMWPILPPGARNLVAQRGMVPYLFRIQPLRSFMLITAVLLIQYTVELFSEKQRIQLENERLKQENLNAQLEAIRQQINPHFFFNTLNTLKTLVKDSRPEALPYLLQLSNVFRYLLRLQQQEWVTLAEELRFLASYQYLLQIRFGEALQIDVAVPDALQATRIPPATLQLLLENAVKHNVVSVSRPLRIAIRAADGPCLVVENNCQPKRTPEPSNRYGLHSLNNRYTHLCGQGIEVAQADGAFRVRLPIIAAEFRHENAHH